jgi:hypothetical protein
MPSDEFHHVERAAYDGFVLTEAIRSGDRYAGTAEGRDDAVLPFNRMRGRQQLRGGRGLRAHDVTVVSGGEEIGRIRLAAAELLDRQIAAEALDLSAQEFRQRRGVEALSLGNRHRADELVAHAG